jgi:hypothetical protein
MPAYCHDKRPPLFATGPDQSRLPEPSPPPWVNCTRAPADFYRSIFKPGLAFVGAVPPLAPQSEDER